MNASMSVFTYLAAGSEMAFEAGCLSALNPVSMTDENKRVFQEGFLPAIEGAIDDYAKDPKNIESTERVFGSGATVEETKAHATHFAQFFVQKGKDYVNALIKSGKLTLIQGSPDAPTQGAAEA